ncbi:MAG: hypothetical protein ACAI44_17405 [Candidatus Sericytochromatia bacterium]
MSRSSSRPDRHQPAADRAGRVGINALDTNGNTALMYAVDCQNREFSEFLIDAGADLEIHSAPHDFMSSNGAEGGNLTALDLASDPELALKMVRKLIHTAKNLPERGYYLAAAAIYKNHPDWIEALLAAGMPIHGYPGPKGDTLLMLAVESRAEPDPILWLLKMGADPRRKNRQGKNTYDALKLSCADAHQSYAPTELANWCRQVRQLLHVR